MRLLLTFFKPILLTLTLFIYAHALATPYLPFMWQVKHQGATVYLVGSVHALTADFYPLPQAYQRAFEQSNRLAVELDPDSLDPNESYRLVQSKMWLPKGITLEQYLTTTELEQLKQFAEEHHSSYPTMLRTRPWMLVEQLTQAQLKDSKYLPEYGIDHYFLEQAKKKDMPILELESLAQQIDALAESPFHAQIAMLKTGLEQVEDEDYMAQMSKYWRSADADGLYSFVYQDVLDNPQLKPIMASLLDQRNQHMADVISIYLGQSPTRSMTTFVVIGALHLSGPNSVIKELEAKGFHPQKVTSLGQ